MKTPCDSLVSLFSAPEAVCSQWGTGQLMLPRWPRCVCRLVMCVCMHLCVASAIWGLVVPVAEQSLFWQIQRGRKTWKKDRGCHMNQVLSWISSSSVSSSQDTPSGGQLASSLGPGWFSITISGWPITRSKSCLRVPAPGASPVPFTSLCADSQAQVPKCLLASRPSSLNSSPLLKLVSSSYFYFPPILY